MDGKEEEEEEEVKERMVRGGGQWLCGTDGEMVMDAGGGGSMGWSGSRRISL